MIPFKGKMLTSTVLPAVFAVGLGIAGAGLAAKVHAACKPCAPKRGCNPCAGKKGSNPCRAKRGCNPCASKKGCNPCAAKKGCNPCGGKRACGACNPCNPCGGGAQNYSKQCVIPRLQLAAKCNPCAAKKACNPCAAKKGCGACNPCAAKKGCNPCAAKKWCGAWKKGCGACNPCAAKKGCNPCAAKKGCGACNPCVAKRGCNPCGACNPCNPCGGAPVVELTAAEAASAYDCLLKEMTTAYSKSKNPIAKNYTNFRRYSKVAYQSATHGNRFVQNYGNDYAKNYGAYENAGTFKPGALLAKDSFTVSGDGKMAVGPLFLMQKMPSGFNKASLDWKYSMIMPDGKVFWATGGKNSAAMNFCYECHNGVAPDQDAVMLLPEEFRVK
jgi:hypothetical protein